MEYLFLFLHHFHLSVGSRLKRIQGERDGGRRGTSWGSQILVVRGSTGDFSDLRDKGHQQSPDNDIRPYGPVSGGDKDLESSDFWIQPTMGGLTEKRTEEVLSFQRTG